MVVPYGSMLFQGINSVRLWIKSKRLPLHEGSDMFQLLVDPKPADHAASSGPGFRAAFFGGGRKFEAFQQAARFGCSQGKFLIATLEPYRKRGKLGL